jgi:hypothetical protein
MSLPRSSPSKGNSSTKAPARRKAMEVDFFQKVLCKKSRLDAGAAAALARWYLDQIREVMPLQGSLRIERTCQMVPVRRRGFYRSLRKQQPVVEERKVWAAIQQVNHKQVVRMMREDKLLAVQPMRFVVTTNSTASLGKRTQTPSSSPDPLSCKEMQERFKKMETVPKEFVSLQGFLPEVENNSRTKPPNRVHYRDVRRGREAYESTRSSIWRDHGLEVRVLPGSTRSQFRSEAPGTGPFQRAGSVVCTPE